MNKIVVSEDGNCPYCDMRHPKCPKCNNEVESRIRELCSPENRVIVKSWKIWNWTVWIKKCAIPGIHFHLKCKIGESKCYGLKDGRSCGTALGGRYYIIIRGCGGIWYEPLDENIKQIDVAKLIKLMEGEKKLEDLLK